MRPTLAAAPRGLLALLVALVPAAATAGGGAPQSRPQQKCLASFTKATAAIAKARTAENRRCLAAFGKGDLAKLDAPSLRSCLARDSKGKLAKQVAKLDKIAAGPCAGAGAPDFGLGGGPRQAAHLAASETTESLLDLFSKNLAATALSCADDPVSCPCQAEVAKGVAAVEQAALKEFGRCAKQALKQGAGSAGELAACLSDAGHTGSIAADSRRKIEKRVTRLARGIRHRCSSTPAVDPFPGQCLGLGGDDLAACAGERAVCRACLLASGAQGLGASCDLADDGAANGSCPGGAVAQETLSLPSAAQPAETPGTLGVSVTNPKLLAQFGGSAVDLNHAIYTRYHWRNPPPGAPDAILVLVPGFEGGASGFQILAENLLARAYVEHGQILEVWAFDRRSHQLEDLEGLDVAEALQDPQIALDWLFGGELGLPLSPQLSRRAEFYDTQADIPFLANWTPLVHSQDIDAVVEAARAAARDGNVFLGGHSAGTGFAARYAATDFDLTGSGPEEPGYAKLRGLVLIEGGGGSTAGTPPDDDTLDLIEARFDGGLFGAVRDDAPRCMDGTTACAPETEDVDCAALTIQKCVLPTTSYASFAGLLSPQLLASSEPTAIQASLDPDGGQAIGQVEQGGVPGNTAISAVPELNILNILPDATAEGLIGLFVDDEGFAASQAAFIAMSVGALGPPVNGLTTWLDTDESDAFPPCPSAGCVTPDNGPPPTDLPAAVWGVEQESIRFDRLIPTFYAGGTNFTDWYYPSSGLSVTQGLPSLDSTALSADPPVGRGRRDIENLTEAGAIDVPVIAFGGSNGLTPVPGVYVPFASSIAPCAAASCDGSTPRVVDDASPSAAFPTFGGAAGGFEVYISEGYAHVDPLAAEDGPGNEVIAPLADFLARNAPPAP
jgi:pimeloyl-ACP methyl ester carboxylesterase